MRSWHACERLHYYQYQLNRRAIDAGEQVAYGTAVHAGLEAWWGWYQHPTADTPLLAAMAALRPSGDDWLDARVELTLSAYDLRWRASMEGVEVLGVEVEFRAPIRTRMRRKMKGLMLGGKIDALIRIAGKVWIVEHKTTGSDISPGATYWQRLRMDPQISVYFAGARALGYEPEGCLYDVIQRIDYKPFLATPEDQRKYTKAGALYANQRAEDESMLDYRLRLTSRIADTPSAWFARAEVIRLEEELRSSEDDVRATALAIRDAQARQYHVRNPDACHRYGRPCAYYPVCSGDASIEDPTRYQQTDQHPELKKESNE
jgi:hypothetical protein